MHCPPFALTIETKRTGLTRPFRAESDEFTGQDRERWKGTKIGQAHRPRDYLQGVRSATRLPLKSTIFISQPTHLHNLLIDCLLGIHSPSNLMPLVRSQRDEFHYIEPDRDATSIERWRVSTSYSQRSSDSRSSLKSTSRNPRFSSKTASRTTAAHRVVRLERVQEDEEGDDYSTNQPRLPQIPMETNVSVFLYIERLGLILVCSRIR